MLSAAPAINLGSLLTHPWPQLRPPRSANPPPAVSSALSCVMNSSTSHHNSNYFSSHAHYFLRDCYNCSLTATSLLAPHPSSSPAGALTQKCDPSNATAPHGLQDQVEAPYCDIESLSWSESCVFVRISPG